MIVVDTSALMAVLLGEPESAACRAVLEGANTLAISAGTVAEALIVSSRRGIGDEMAALITALQMEVVPVTLAIANRISDAYSRWGKGVHPAGLNFGDCHAYALAKERGCELLFVGNDFSGTDIASALH